MKAATENLPLVPHSPQRRDPESCLRTDGGKERGKFPTLAGHHGTGDKSSSGAESASGIEPEKGTVIGSVAEKENAAEGRRGRDTGRRRESDTEIKTQTRGENGSETGKERDPGILTEGIMTETEGETVIVTVTVIESETGDGTDLEAGIVTGTGTETVGKTGPGTETGRGREREKGIVETEAEAEKRERRERTVNTILPRRVIKLQKMTRACHSLCFKDTT